MNTELIEIVKWLQCNKLSLNIDKTKFMIFSSKRRDFTAVENGVIINGNKVEKVSEIKFLGVVLDCKLSWSSHIQKIRNKIAKSIGVICQARKILKSNTLRLLYNTFIQPHLIYCIEIWGGTYSTYLIPLIKIQKKAIRIISSVPARTHTEPLFVKHNILNVSKLYQYFIAIFMYKYTKEQLPDFCKNLFTSNNNVHDYNTRQRTQLHVPVTSSNLFKRTIRFKGVSIWNSLCSTDIKINCSIFCFKKTLKKFLQGNSLL
jgi:hypothetical protein